jgi:hypothetical protein
MKIPSGKMKSWSLLLIPVSEFNQKSEETDNPELIYTAVFNDKEQWKELPNSISASGSAS